MAVPQSTGGLRQSTRQPAPALCVRLLRSRACGESVIMYTALAVVVVVGRFGDRQGKRFPLANVNCPPELLFSVAPYPECRKGDTLCAKDFAIGVMTSAATVHRLQHMHHWMLPAARAGAVVRIFMAQRVEQHMIPEPLRPLVVVLDIPEVSHHSATNLTMLMNSRMIKDFPTRKWYGKLDDDAFFILPNLIYTMNRWIAGGRKDIYVPSLRAPQKRLIVLSKLLWGLHLSGGAGYFHTAAAFQHAMDGMRANVGNCMRTDLPGEDQVLTCIYRAQKTKLIDMPGMYINSLKGIARHEHVYASLEGLVKYPITFHWIHTESDAMDIMGCSATVV